MAVPPGAPDPAVAGHTADVVQVVGHAPGFQALWSAFSRSGNQQEYCQGWLDLQCARIPALTNAVLLLHPSDDADEAFATMAQWPADVAVPQALLALADDAAAEACGLVVELEDAGAQGRFGAAYPLKIDDRVAGVVVAAIDSPDETALAGAMEKLQWGIAWIELMLRRHHGSMLEAELPRIKSAVEILTAVLAENTYESACATFVTTLASVMRCERVSLGTRRRGRVRIAAISHSAEFGKQMNLVRLLEAAMEESVFQRAEITYPPAAGEQLVSRDHAALAAAHGCGTSFSLPLFGDGRYIGALTLERAADEPFSDKELDQVRAIVALCTEALAMRRRAGRGLAAHTIDITRQALARVFGGGHLGTKLGLILLAATVAFFSVATANYRIAADTELEGAVHQVVVAPFAGYIQSAEARAGDQVTAGQTLSRLDDRDLRLERLNWKSERAMLERRYQEALAQHDRGEARVLDAQLQQNQAQLDLVASRLERIALRAPFSGLVVSGDLSQRLGSSVEQGEVLFEIAPLDAYRAILWVDEHEMADIATGLEGQLVLKALPEEQLSFEVTKLTPITEARDGGNFFRVEAALEAAPGRLRPGMEGVAKIEVGERRLIYKLTRPLVRWLRLTWWAWTP